MKRIYLFRHGDVEDKYKKRFRGALDVELSPLGIRMSQVNAKFLSELPVELVVTSGLKRTDLVGELAGRLGVRHEIDSRFREASFGRWEGKNWEEVQNLYPTESRLYKENFTQMRFPGGESIEELKTRLLKGWEALLARKENRIAVIGHSTGNGCLLSHLKNTEFAKIGMQPVGSFHEIEFQHGHCRVVCENQALY